MKNVVSIMNIIECNKELETFCDELNKQKFITVDTEFLRENTYYPNLCLIQIACNDCEAIIDPIAGNLNFEPLFKVFNNKNVIKVFHSARQDLEIIINLCGKIPEPICDTQVMAMVCGFGTAVSYANLVEKLLDVKIDKSSRFTDWSRRPLSQKQLDYALSDVTYLKDVYLQLQSKISDMNRDSWVLEEMQILKSKETYFPDKENLWKKLNPKGNSRKFLGIVKELVKWREGKAQYLNVPRNRVLRDSIILEIAASAPDTIEKLSKMRVAGKAVIKHSERILKTINHVNSLDENELPEIKSSKRKSDEDLALIEMIKLLLKIVSAKNEVATKIIADSDQVKILATDDVEKESLPAMHGWRYEIFGKYVKLMIEGKIALCCKNGVSDIVNID